VLKARRPSRKRAFEGRTDEPIGLALPHGDAPLGRLLVVGVVLMTRGPVKRELEPPVRAPLLFASNAGRRGCGWRRGHPEARRTMPQIARWLVEPVLRAFLNPHRNSRPSLPVNEPSCFRAVGMILFSTAHATLSAASMAMLSSPRWADLFALVFVVSTFVAICAAESS